MNSISIFLLFDKTKTWLEQWGLNPRPHACRACTLPPELYSNWWSEMELNHRHGDFQSTALPTELSDHGLSTKFVKSRSLFQIIQTNCFIY